MDELNAKYPKWFRDRGYLHLTGKESTVGRTAMPLFNKITNNQKFISEYAFFPLIHTNILERRYKKINQYNHARAHSFKQNGVFKRTIKSRPIHYANHTDALIFGHYSSILRDKHEELLNSTPELSSCIIGYRKVVIPGLFKNDGSPKYAGTAHFAREAFEEIKSRTLASDCTVLKFDIEKFFSSMDHKILLRAWSNLLELPKLPKDHYNVYKASTRMHYILLDDLRRYQTKKGRKAGFDEKKLAGIRKGGAESLYTSVQELRLAIKNKEITVYKNPFTNRKTENQKTGEKWISKGIPQGLPISSTLANIYLLDFDRTIYEQLVQGKDCYYRRYSDDLIVICKPEDAREVKKFVIEAIESSGVSISEEKTEEFLFGHRPKNTYSSRLTSIKIGNEKQTVNYPFTFLGFEFYGYQTLIKSANLAKFYRRMIYSIKRKSKRALKIADENDESPVLFHNQLLRLYKTKDLRKTEIKRSRKWLKPNRFGVYVYRVNSETKPLRSNYFSYLKRSADTMGDKRILRQIRKHHFIYNQAIERHFRKGAI